MVTDWQHIMLRVLRTLTKFIWAKWSKWAKCWTQDTWDIWHHIPKAFVILRHTMTTWLIVGSKYKVKRWRWRRHDSEECNIIAKRVERAQIKSSPGSALSIIISSLGHSLTAGCPQTGHNIRLNLLHIPGKLIHLNIQTAAIFPASFSAASSANILLHAQILMHLSASVPVSIHPFCTRTQLTCTIQEIVSQRHISLKSNIHIRREKMKVKWDWISTWAHGGAQRRGTTASPCGVHITPVVQIASGDLLFIILNMDMWKSLVIWMLDQEAFDECYTVASVTRVTNGKLCLKLLYGSCASWAFIRGNSCDVHYLCAWVFPTIRTLLS